MDEMKKILEEMNKMIGEIRNKAVERDKQREKSSDGITSDPITREEFVKINTKMDEVEEKYSKEAAEWKTKYTEVFDELRTMKAQGSAKVQGEGSSEERKLTKENHKRMFPNVLRGLAYGFRGIPYDAWLNEKIYRSEERKDGGKEKRVGLLDDTATGGHYLIPEWGPQYIDMLQSALVFNKFNPEKMVPTGPVPVNTLSAEPTAYTFEAGGSITISNPTFSQEMWNPIRIGVACPVDGPVVRRADNSVNIVNTKMQDKAALRAEYQMLYGSGANGQMTGLKNLGGNVNAYNMHTTNQYGKFTDSNNINRLMELISMIEHDEAMMEGWIFSSRTKWNMRAVQTAANGDYILTVPNNAGDPPLLLGYPYAVTNQIPNTFTVNGKTNCSDIFAGQWSDMVIAVWEDILMSMDPSASYVSGATTYSCRQYDQVLFTLIYEINCKYKHDKAFGYIVGVQDNNAA